MTKNELISSCILMGFTLQPIVSSFIILKSKNFTLYLDRHRPFILLPEEDTYKYYKINDNAISLILNRIPNA